MTLLKKTSLKTIANAIVGVAIVVFPLMKVFKLDDFIGLLNGAEGEFAATDEVWKTSLDNMDHVFIDIKTNRLSLPLIQDRR